LNMIEKEKARQGFDHFVPEQFTVLYGIKSLAVSKLNEFFYAIRECRFRKNAKGEVEDEPMLYFFWQACHHGVPFEERLPHEDFEFFVDLLGAVAKTAADEHTLKLQGVGAFWHMFGSMTEIQLPAFVLVNALQRRFGTQPSASEESPHLAHTGHSELLQRLKKVTMSSSAKQLKDSKQTGRKAIVPAPSYKPQLLGADAMQHGFLPLETFLSLCLEGFHAQQLKDAQSLQVIWQTWLVEVGEESFDVFAGMLEYCTPQMSEAEMLNLYQKATSGDNNDKVDMVHIEADLRKASIVLKRKPGSEEAGTAEQARTASAAIGLLGKVSSTAQSLPDTACSGHESAGGGPKSMGAWGRAASSKLFDDIHKASVIRSLFGPNDLP